MKTFLHDQIARELRAEIVSRKRPGDRLDTEPILAARFQTSIITIRNAMLVLEREGLVQRRQGSGTYVRDFHADRHVAIILSSDTLTNPRLHAFHLQTAHRIWEHLEQLRRRGRIYLARTENGQRPTTAALAELADAIHLHKVAAVISLTMLPVAFSEHIVAAGVPLLGTDDRSRCRPRFDYEQLVRDGLRYLLGHGCRRIGMLGWGAPHYHRLGGVFTATAAQHGLEPDPAWMRDDLSPTDPGAGWEAFREVWTARREKPDGLLICDDVLYRDAASAIIEAGVRVPDELRVVTHCNKDSDLRHLFPVALLECDAPAYATALAGATLALLAGQAPARAEIILPHRLVKPDHLPAQPQAVASLKGTMP